MICGSQMEATVPAQQFNSAHGLIQHILTITQEGPKLLHNASVLRNCGVLLFLSPLVLFVSNQK